MLKITIQVKEKEENKINVGIKKINEKEFNSSTNLEKLVASEIKAAIDAVIYNLSTNHEIKKDNMKEGN